MDHEHPPSLWRRIKKSAKVITGNRRQVKQAHPERSLPMELSEQIILYLLDDLESLICCGLVCRTWLAISRPHLFREICLDYRNTDEFASLVLHSLSTIPPSVKRLELVPSPPPDPRWLRRLVPFLGYLADVSSLHIENIDWSGLHSNSRMNFVSTFNTLTEMYLGYVTFMELSEVVAMICSFPLLESISLDHVTWINSQLAGTVNRVPASVKKLSLLSTRIHPILSWLLSHDQPHIVKNLGLDSISDADTQAIRQYLGIVGPSLEAIKIGVQGLHTGSRTPINTRAEAELTSTSCPSSLPIVTSTPCVMLSLLTGLRSLELSNFIHHTDHLISSASFWAPIVIESLNSTHTEKVALEASLSNMEELDALSIDWERLDQALNRPVYSTLQGVYFRLKGSVNRVALSTFIQAKLPICHGRGLLYFE